MKTIGTIFRELREAKGILLRHVAAAVDMDATLLSKIENEDRLPTKQQLEKLAEYYNQDANELMASWLSDKIVQDIMHEKMALRAVKMAEQKIKKSLK
jgi:transcriptional regulator with XRE-family HTH domain